jgi:hypothetical protein
MSFSVEKKENLLNDNRQSEQGQHNTSNLNFGNQVDVLPMSCRCPVCLAYVLSMSCRCFADVLSMSCLYRVYVLSYPLEICRSHVSFPYPNPHPPNPNPHLIPGPACSILLLCPPPNPNHYTCSHLSMSVAPLCLSGPLR